MKPKIKTSDLVARVGACTAMPEADVKQVVDEVIRQIRTLTAKGSTVILTSLGKFVPMDRKARIIETPKTKKPTEIPARRVLTFKPTRETRRLV